MHTVRKVFLALTATISLAANATAQKDGIVAWWKFNEGNGSFAEDSASGHRDRIINHHQWVKGASESGLKFDGFNDDIAIEGATQRIRFDASR